MDETYSLTLALVDFIPNLAFLVGAFFLVRLVGRTTGIRAAWLCALGSGLVFAGGLLKAIWKLLFTLGIGDFQALSQQQFILLAPGFLALLISAILLARASRAVKTPAAVTAIALWKVPLMAVMTLCSLGLQGILTYLAFNRGARLAAWCFMFAALSLFGMSAMGGSLEQTTANQWIEEITNTFGQAAFAIGSWQLSSKYRLSGSA